MATVYMDICTQWRIKDFRQGVINFPWPNFTPSKTEKVAETERLCIFRNDLAKNEPVKRLLRRRTSEFDGPSPPPVAALSPHAASGRQRGTTFGFRPEIRPPASTIRPLVGDWHIFEHILCE